MLNGKAAFLGPQSENDEVLERLILEALRDHVYWRRNFHPEDPRSITEGDKIQQGYLSSNAELQKELFTILAELKRGVPFFSPRYLGHINSDLLIPAVVGYFAAMLYNQNNVVAEASPVTVVKELEYIKALAFMLSLPTFDRNKLSNYGEDTSWGHLCSGGTTANIEAAWTARNVKFYPLAVRLLSECTPSCSVLKKLRITLPDGSPRELGQMSAYSLLSLTPADAMRLRRTVVDFGPQLEVDGKLEEVLPSIQRLGLMGFRDLCRKYNLDFGLPKILLSQTAHYCWPKGADLLGLGGEGLIPVSVDDGFRMDLKELGNEIHKLHETETPLLAVVSICGTTEEGAIDPLHNILTLRGEIEKTLSSSFWIHSDAAFGGYFASMLRGGSDEAIQYQQRFPAIDALGAVDSIAIDPHKLGYIPYPAGAILYRDARVREFISYEAPYLRGDEDVTRAFLGQWTLEGSRPGAAAISCYLAQHCYPLNLSGHGRFLSTCISAMAALMTAFEAINSDEHRNRGFRIVPFFEPELNIICYVLMAPGVLSSLGSLNKLTEEVFSQLTVSGDFHANHYQYIVSKTAYPVDRYRSQVKSLLARCGIHSEPSSKDSLVTLRSVLMNALADEPRDLFERFVENLCRIADESLGKIRFDLIQNAFRDRSENRRMKVLILEDNADERSSLKQSLELSHPLVSSGLEVRTATTVGEAIEELDRFEPDAAIVDLKLEGGDFGGLTFISQLKARDFLNFVAYSAYMGEPIVEHELDELGIPPDRRVRKMIPPPGAANEADRRQSDHRLILNPLLSFLDQ